MAVPRTRLGGLMGGGTIVPQNNIDVGGVLDAVQHGVTSSITNAYYRKRQAAQDKAMQDQRDQIERDRQAQMQAQAQERAERLQAGERDYQLRLRTIQGTEEERRAKAAEVERLRLEKANAPKPPVRGTPEYEAMLNREGAIKNRLRPVPAGAANAVTHEERLAKEARAAVPKLRPIEARPTVTVDQSSGVKTVQPPPDPGAAARFVADSTALDTRATDLETRAGLPPIPKLHTPYGGGKPYAPGAGGSPPAAAPRPFVPLPPTTGAAPKAPGLDRAGLTPTAPPVGTPDHASAWMDANPRLPNEPDAAYKARYYKATASPPPPE